MNKLGLAEALQVITHQALLEREAATGMTLRLTAIGLLAMADPEHGVVLADLAKVKETIYPKQRVALRKHLAELKKARVIKTRKQQIFFDLTADLDLDIKAQASNVPVIKDIFEFWKTTMGKKRSHLSTERMQAINDRLLEGYTADDIKLAITGCTKSLFHMGHNDRRTRYDDLTLICRNASKLESFMQKKGGLMVSARGSAVVERKGM